MDTTLIGVIGATLLLIAFITNETKWLSSESFQYDLINLLGAGFLTWYAIRLNSLPFIVLEGIWTLVALWHILRLARKR